jgi:hypothetical protein
MPNCDWNRPCDCIECRTIYDAVVCPKCGFKNTVSIVRNVKGYSTDNKGLGGYDFEVPTEPLKDLKCYKCGYTIEKVNYYTKIEERFCKRELERETAINNGKVCSECGKVEDIDYSATEYVKLQKKDGSLLCQQCLAAWIKRETPDPSNENEKYLFDNKQYKWILDKVKKACIDCGKKRWLNVENQWKVRCESCYKRKS